MFSLVLNATEQVGGKHAVHLSSFRINVNSVGFSVKPIVPPFTCTDVAVARIIVVARAMSRTPPFVVSQFMHAWASAVTDTAVRILRFFVAPIWPPVGVSDVQKYPT